MNTKVLPLSVVINTKNSGTTLEETLKSVKPYVNEFIVVDMHSTDNTVKIAEKYGAKVFTHKVLQYADPARNFALSKATNSWILVLDADETLPETFIPILEDITTGVFAKVQNADTYWLPRKNMIWGKWIQHTGWWPDYQLRLFRNGKATWQGNVHQMATPLGSTAYIQDKEEYSIVHNNYPTVENFIERLNRYTTIQATQTNKEAKSPSDILKAFFGEFERRFLGESGIDDDIHGTALSLYQGIYEMTVLLKKAEAQGIKTQSMSSEETIQTLNQVKKELSYWIADYKIRHSNYPKKFFWKLRRKFSW